MQNIFRKECPQCASANAVTAVRCTCGYCFDPDALDGVDAAEYEAEQQRLYRDYLEARLVQAEADAIVARDESNTDLENTLKRANALRAEQELNGLRAEFAQTPKPAMRAKPAAVTKTPAPRQPIPTNNAGVHMPRSAAVNPQKVVATSVTAPKAPQTSAATIPTDDFRRLQSAKADAALAQTRFKRAQAPAAKAPPAPKPQQMRPPAMSIKKAPEVLRAAPAAAPKQECPLCTAHVPVDAPRCGCGFVFENISTEIPSLTAAPAAVTTPRPVVETKQECPNCTATVPITASRCGCGYILESGGSEMPGVTLDAKALSILTGR